MATQDYTNGVTLSDAAEAERFDCAAYAVLSAVAGTNTITATGPATYTLDATRPPVWFIPAATNTGATTINITPSGGAALTAKNIFSNGAACVGGELVINVPVGIVYDGTQFNIIGALTKAGTVDLSLGSLTGIKFDATQNASADANTLDDYEEGTWTPVLTFATGGNLSVAYSEQAGSYTKIGRLVILRGNIITSTFTHTTASGALQITGCPFTSASTTSEVSVGSVHWQGITKANYTSVQSRVDANSAIVTFFISGSGQTGAVVAAADMPTGGTVGLRFQIMFQV